MDTSSTTSENSSPTTVWRWLVGLFSSVKFGIFLLVLLFVYSAIGSAGLPLTLAIWEPGSWTAVRSWRGLEMTEFEWFNWWPFTALIALTCLTLIVTTIRKIPFNLVNLGVWMVHTGLIILAAGCVFYFATKIEGDVPLARGRVNISIPGIEPVSLRAMPGHEKRVQGPDGLYSFSIVDTDPDWELLTGVDAGKRAYAVKVMVQTPKEQFIRQLLAGYPDYTEDMVRSDDPSQPWARAIKTIGSPLINNELSITLEPDSQSRFWVMDSAAIYLRELVRNGDGSTRPLTPWVERPIEGLPRYNEYLQFRDEAWLPQGEDAVSLGRLSVSVPPASANDPLADRALEVTSYLPYAGLESRDIPGGEQLNPVASLSLDTSDGRSVDHRMFAFDENPVSPDPSLMRFIWIADEKMMQDMLQPKPPRLRLGVPAADISEEIEIPGFVELDEDLPWTPLQGTDVSFRVRRVDDELKIRGRKLSMARVELRNGNRTWLRWIFNNPTLNGDFDLDGPTDGHVASERVVDESITSTYLPATGSPAPVTLVAGPGSNQLRMISTLMPGGPQVSDVTVGKPLTLGPDVTMTVSAFDDRVKLEQRPRVVARRARQPRAGGQLSMIKIRTPIDESRGQSAWLSYHHYPFENETDVLRRFRYQPTVITLPDGRLVEAMYSRRSAPLPTSVQLDGFEIASHVGGFTGEVSSVLNWISQVRFEGDEGSRAGSVSVNNPEEENGYWYFQAQWDPPETSTNGQPASKGLNYTVLGVGNRNGVWTMLAGSILSTIGMIYAFYVKPMIKRRRSQAVYERLKGATA